MSVQNVQTLGTKVVGQPVSEDDDVKVEGIGSGFIWDKFGHIVRNSFLHDMHSPFTTSSGMIWRITILCLQVTNYHVIAKLAMDSSGRQKAQVRN